MPNIYEPEWVERTEAPFRGRVARIAAPAGAERLGASLYELEPVRALVVSTMSYPDLVEMPDSDKVLVLSDPPGTGDRLFGAFPRAAMVDRLHGELDDP